MVTHGSIGEFQHTQEPWQSYVERLQQYFVANDVDAAEKQRAILLSIVGGKTYQLIRNCHGEYGPTLNWSGGTIYGSQKWSGTIFGCRKWSPRTNYGCHKRSPPAITGPGRTIRGNKIIIVKKGSGTIFGCRLIRRSRNILAIYELPSRNEDQMEFRYKHWCGRAERGRTCAPPCRRYSGTAVGPVTARADQLWHAETGPPDQIWRRTNYCVTEPPRARQAHRKEF